MSKKRAQRDVDMVSDRKTKAIKKLYESFTEMFTKIASIYIAQHVMDLVDFTSCLGYVNDKHYDAVLALFAKNHPRLDEEFPKMKDGYLKPKWDQLLLALCKQARTFRARVASIVRERCEQGMLITQIYHYLPEIMAQIDYSSIDFRLSLDDFRIVIEFFKFAGFFQPGGIIKLYLRPLDVLSEIETKVSNFYDLMFTHRRLQNRAIARVFMKQFAPLSCETFKLFVNMMLRGSSKQEMVSTLTPALNMDGHRLTYRREGSFLPTFSNLSYLGPHLLQFEDHQIGEILDRVFGPLFQHYPNLMAVRMIQDKNGSFPEHQMWDPDTIMTNVLDPNVFINLALHHVCVSDCNRLYYHPLLRDDLCQCDTCTTSKTDAYNFMVNEPRVPCNIILAHQMNGYKDTTKLFKMTMGDANQFADKIMAAARIDNEDDAPKCAICQDVVKRALGTPCNHVFCSTCLADWIMGQYTSKLKCATCPICRSEIRFCHMIPVDRAANVRAARYATRDCADREGVLQWIKDNMTVVD